MSGAGGMRVAVVITGDANGLKAEVREATGALDQLGRSGRQAGDQLGGGMQIAAAAAARLAPLLGAAGVAGGLMAVARAGDEMTASLGRLQAATGSITQAADTYNQLYRISLQTGVSVRDSADAFARFSIAARQIGATREEVTRLVEGLQMAAAVGGASTQEAASATMQLAQALGSGKLQGDELRSVMESMPTLIEALSRELGVSVGELRKMGEEGKLTSEVVFPALLRALAGIRSEFEQLPGTMARGFQQLGVATTRFVADLDQAVRLSATIARIVTGVAGSIDRMRREAGLGTELETARINQERARGQVVSTRVARDTLVEQNAREQEAAARSQSPGAGLLARERGVAIARLEQQLATAQTAYDAASRRVAELTPREEASFPTHAEFLAGTTIPPPPPEPPDPPAGRGASRATTRNPLTDRLSVIQGAIEGERRLAAATLEGGRAAALAEADTRASAEAHQAARDGSVSLAEALVRLREGYRELADAQAEARASALQYQDAQSREELALRGGLIGASAQDRARRTAEFRRRQEIDRAGIDPNSERGRGLIAAAAAEASERLELERQEAAFDSIGRFGERAFDRIGEAATRMAAEGKMSFKDLGNIGTAVASELMQEFTRLALLNPLKNMLLGGNAPTLLDVGARLLPSLFAAGAGAPGVSMAEAPGILTAGMNSGAALFHTGGIVGSGDGAMRLVPPSLFAGAPRFHGGGMIGPNEVPAILERGEGVFTAAQMRALGPAGGGGDVQLNVTFQGGDLGSTSDRERMAAQLRAVVREEVAAAAPGIARGAHELTLSEARRGGRAARELGRR